MNLQLTLTDDQLREIARCVAAEMIATGAAVAAPVRTRPYSVAEAALELGLSEQSIRRDIEAGRLARIPNTARVLIPVESLQARTHA